MDTREAIANRMLKLYKESDLTPNRINNFPAVPQSSVKSILKGESEKPDSVTIISCAMDSKSP